MKKIILTILIIFLLSAGNFTAYSVDEATQAAKDDKLEKLRELKEKVAEKVAQLKNDEAKVYVGEVSQVKEENIFLSTKDTKLKVQTNSQTKFIWLNTDGKKLNLSLKAFTGSDQIVTWGTFNKETGVLTARGVSGRIPLLMLSCLVTKIDNVEKIITCQDKKAKIQYNLSVDQKTKILSWQKKVELKTETWLQVKVGSRLLVKGVKKGKIDLVNPLLILIISLSSPVTSE